MRDKDALVPNDLARASQVTTWGSVPDLIAAASDLTLVLDRGGVVREVAVGNELEEPEVWSGLVGRKWAETVAVDSRNKIPQLLREARRGPTQRREINQIADGVGEIPFLFRAALLDPKQQRVIALGRDLRPISRLQQQLVSVQQAMDREYDRVRQADTRYRVLFRVSNEGVLVVDASNRRILELNPAAANLVGEPAEALQGRAVQEIFEARNSASVLALLSAVEAGAPPTDTLATINGRKVIVACSLFRQGTSALVLVRLRVAASPASSSLAARDARALRVLETMPDGFVVTNEDLEILMANASFCEAVQQANEKTLLGKPLDRWLGRPGVDLPIIIANLREHGSVRSFSTVLRSDFSEPAEATVSAVSAVDGKVPCFGFCVRLVSSRVIESPAAMPRSIEQMKELVGRVPLRTLVRESADLVERLCIEAALEVSGNNRASAAQLLGLSRQGLYSKLRRYGITDPET